jgi:hypothetical protein
MRRQTKLMPLLMLQHSMTPGQQGCIPKGQVKLL